MTETPDPQPQDTPNPEAKYTDRDVDKFKGDARKEGRQAAERHLAESLGASVEEAKKIIADHRVAEEATKTEIEKKDGEIQTLKQRAEQAEALAESRLIDAEMRSALIAGGVPAERVGDALRLAGRDSITVKEDGSVDGLDASVEALKGSSAYLFAAPAPTAPRTAPDATRQPDLGPNVTGADRLRAMDWTKTG